MRDLKFRAKRCDNGKWVHGYFCLRTHQAGTIEEETISLIVTDAGISYTVDPKTVGQFIGLEDRNGDEICEGDIIRHHDNPNDLAEVRFGEFGIRDIDTEEVVDNAFGWYGKVIKTDAMSEVAPFCYDRVLNDYWIEKMDVVIIGTVHD